MRYLITGLALVVPLTVAAVPAYAQDGDRVASASIARGDLATAERTLVQELRIHPNRPELMLNLAAVYAKTGRREAARALYEGVLAQDDVLMDVSADRTAGSHAVATAGLRRLETVQVSASR
ncbi:tetratricopeptide repeat protein [Sphingomonas sp. LB-2]|uniref:tetratricopeptide repeat protein n=1 Tax=Sphingomonas caeni TaxID=2984949 RepID=UPI0022320737|nr:tetratricopeptide repeat protein [Sphingomonas caeni]MCW3849583.1 tetratricopeptide repeat protein [Sphingomonas caeni]